MRTKKIEITDLQLNDLLYHIPHQQKKRIIRVHTMQSGFKDLNSYYKPILLTRKRLEKNGFVFDSKEVELKKEWWYTKVTEAYSLDNMFKCKDFWLKKNETGYVITDHYMIKPFKYVHEFQHVLRLFGKTDLADNFEVE